jgi:hypothetical protein
MTTISQVKKAVQPLLQRNPDLALVGRLVVLKPVHHIVCGVYICSSSNPDEFVPTWAVNFLFEPSASFTLSWGGRLYNPAPGYWDVKNPATSETMSAKIERDALPILRPIQTIDDFVAFVSRERFPYHPFDADKHRKIYVDVARGDFESARELCAVAIEGADPESTKVEWLREAFELNAKTICPLLAANDRAGLVQLLHDIEAQAARDLKLEKLWEPTPFPLELQSAG